MTLPTPLPHHLLIAKRLISLSPTLYNVGYEKMGQEIIDVPSLKSKKVRDLALGFIAGYVANYLWEQYKLFGYGVPLFNITKTHSVGQDDAILVAIGVAIYFMDGKNFGLGWILAQVVEKIYYVLTTPEGA